MRLFSSLGRSQSATVYKKQFQFPQEANSDKVISQSELKRLYLGKTNSLSGESIKPIALKEGNEEQYMFMKEVLGMTPDEIKQHWIKEGLTGGGRPPRAMSSKKSLIRLLDNNLSHSILISSCS